MKPLCDIDVLSEITPDDKAVLGSTIEQAGTPTSPQQPQKAAEQHQGKGEEQEHFSHPGQSNSTNKHANLATPAVRGLLKELKVGISEVTGTGKDGRVMKEDVHNFAASRSSSTNVSLRHQPSSAEKSQTETPITLTPIQTQMFKTMTRSLQIPHFIYADELNVTALSSLRTRLNTHPATPDQPKLSYLPFIIKALSLALNDYPLLNARLEAPYSPTTEQKPRLILRSQHNIGIAMDTPQGLLVPNIKSVNTLSIPSIAHEIQRLQSLALASKLSPKDLTGGTITVSNIGSIGGTYVSPVLVNSEVAILGIGKKKMVPAFDEGGAVVRREVMNLSWAADPRVVDGGTVARCAEVVRGLVEGPEGMVVRLR